MVLMVGKKGRRTLWCDIGKLKELEDRGFGSVSDVIDRIADTLLSEEYDDIATQLRLQILDNKIYETRVKLAEFRLAIAASEHDIVEFERMKVDTIKQWEYTKNTVRRTQHIKRLNRVIVAGEYDIHVVQETGKEIISNIMEIDPEFNLQAHVSRLKSILKS